MAEGKERTCNLENEYLRLNFAHAVDCVHSLNILFDSPPMDRIETKSVHLAATTITGSTVVQLSSSCRCEVA
ncbi:hypothetical protein TYRP_007483 [Tyrophagus putrescentiae]|nr:hypothetical protein TYRP_007483 [Tyrophagus putrescentiae]